ncbi:MAG: hypothetical protein JO071_06300 [Deltaproteobacteria bacterium]|nr:hypothetical protein [Deltaproteobacteria bacterium]
MTKRQSSEKLLAVAKKVAAAEYALNAARIEYDALFQEIANGRSRRDVGSVRVSETMVQAPLSAVSANSYGPLKVEQKVYKFIQERGSAQDAKSVAEGTGVPVPSVRWAFVKLSEKGVIKKEQRGKYAVAYQPEAEAES